MGSKKDNLELHGKLFRWFEFLQSNAWGNEAFKQIKSFVILTHFYYGWGFVKLHLIVPKKKIFEVNFLQSKPILQLRLHHHNNDFNGHR